MGKERDEETGLYYYGARYYAPWIQRFISTDPLKDDYPYYSSYQYAGNKPINSIDVDGLEAANKMGTNVGQQSTSNVKAVEKKIPPIFGKDENAQVTTNSVHFFSNRTGKHLGQIDGVTETIDKGGLLDGNIFRTISDNDFKSLKKNGATNIGESYETSVNASSSIIKIDKTSFNSFNKVNEGGTVAGPNEKSLFVILDVNDPKKPILRARFNQNSTSTNTGVSDELDISAAPDFVSTLNSKKEIVVGQAHSHPLQKKNSGTINAVGVSYIPNGNGESDVKTAIDNGIPILALQSYSTGEGNGNIFMVDQFGNLNLENPQDPSTQKPIGNIKNIGTQPGRFNVILDTFKKYSGFP